MEASAFCPAHITGFFKAHIGDGRRPEDFGSMGAGFSIKEGVTTHVRVLPGAGREGSFKITQGGYPADRTDVSESVLGDFLERGDFGGMFFDIRHEISVPVGFGLGSSGAVALSLAYALDRALGTNLDKTEIGRIAHDAEIRCRTGLGDVLASYHGGFEIRVKPGAPGTGVVEKIDAEPVAVSVICFSPVPTDKFIEERLSRINGVGEGMVNRLLETRDYGHFQDMSLEFAKCIRVMTPRMEEVVGALSSRQIKCGVALFGETVFSMVPREKESAVAGILERYSDGLLIRSEIDGLGARVLHG